MYCLDASVIVSAALEKEPSSKRSRAFLNMLTDTGTKVFLPVIVLAEVASALTRATKNAAFVEEFINSSLRIIPNFTFVAVDDQLVTIAVNVITRTRLRGTDALYVALAIHYNLTLITLDREQLLKGKSVANIIEPPLLDEINGDVRK